MKQYLKITANLIIFSFSIQSALGLSPSIPNSYASSVPSLNVPRLTANSPAAMSELRSLINQQAIPAQQTAEHINGNSFLKNDQAHRQIESLLSKVRMDFFSNAGSKDEEELYRLLASVLGLKGKAIEVGSGKNNFPADGLLKGGIQSVASINLDRSKHLLDPVTELIFSEFAEESDKDEKLPNWIGLDAATSKGWSGYEAFTVRNDDVFVFESLKENEASAVVFHRSLSFISWNSQPMFINPLSWLGLFRIQRWKRVEQVLKNAKRALAQDGWLIIVIELPGSRRALGGFFQKLAEQIYKAFKLTPFRWFLDRLVMRFDSDVQVRLPKLIEQIGFQEPLVISASPNTTDLILLISQSQNDGHVSHAELRADYKSKINKLIGSYMDDEDRKEVARLEVAWARKLYREIDGDIRQVKRLRKAEGLLTSAEGSPAARELQQEIAEVRRFAQELEEAALRRYENVIKLLGDDPRSELRSDAPLKSFHDLTDQTTADELTSQLSSMGFSVPDILRSHGVWHKGQRTVGFEGRHEVQLPLLDQELRQVIQEKTRQSASEHSLTIYFSGLGLEFNELIIVTTEFLKVIKKEIAEQKNKWNINIVGLDISHDLVRALQHEYGDDFVRAHETDGFKAVRFLSRVVDFADLKQIQAVSREIGPADFIFHRNVTYANQNASEGQIGFEELKKAVHTAHMVYSYLHLHNLLSALAKSGTRYVTETTAQLSGVDRNEKHIVIPGSEIVSKEKFEGTGIYRIEDPLKAVSMSFFDFLKGIDNSVMSDPANQPRAVSSAQSELRTASPEVPDGPNSKPPQYHSAGVFDHRMVYLDLEKQLGAGYYSHMIKEGETLYLIRVTTTENDRYQYSVAAMDLSSGGLDKTKFKEGNLNLEIVSSKRKQTKYKSIAVFNETLYVLKSVQISNEIERIFIETYCLNDGKPDTNVFNGALDFQEIMGETKEKSALGMVISDGVLYMAIDDWAGKSINIYAIDAKTGFLKQDKLQNGKAAFDRNQLGAVFYHMRFFGDELILTGHAQNGFVIVDTNNGKVTPDKDWLSFIPTEDQKYDGELDVSDSRVSERHLNITSGENWHAADQDTIYAMIGSGVDSKSDPIVAFDKQTGRIDTKKFDAGIFEFPGSRIFYSLFHSGDHLYGFGKDFDREKDFIFAYDLRRSFSEFNAAFELPLSPDEDPENPSKTVRSELRRRPIDDGTARPEDTRLQAGLRHGNENRRADRTLQQRAAMPKPSLSPLGSRAELRNGNQKSHSSDWITAALEMIDDPDNLPGGRQFDDLTVAELAQLLESPYQAVVDAALARLEIIDDGEAKQAFGQLLSSFRRQLNELIERKNNWIQKNVTFNDEGLGSVTLGELHTQMQLGEEAVINNEYLGIQHDVLEVYARVNKILDHINAIRKRLEMSEPLLPPADRVKKFINPAHAPFNPDPVFDFEKSAVGSWQRGQYQAPVWEALEVKSSYYYEKVKDFEIRGTSGKFTRELLIRQFTKFRNRQTGKIYFGGIYDANSAFAMMASHLFFNLLGLPVRETYVLRDQNGKLVVLREFIENGTLFNRFHVKYGRNVRFSKDWEKVLRGAFLLDQIIGYTDRDESNLFALVTESGELVPLFVDMKFSLGIPKEPASESADAYAPQYDFSKYVEPFEDTKLHPDFAYNGYYQAVTREDLLFIAKRLAFVTPEYLRQIIQMTDQLVPGHSFDLEKLQAEWEKSLLKAKALYSSQDQAGGAAHAEPLDRSELRLVGFFEGGQTDVMVIHPAFVIGNLARKWLESGFQNRHIIFNFQKVFHHVFQSVEPLLYSAHPFAERAKLPPQIFKNHSELAVSGKFGSWIWNFIHNPSLDSILPTHPASMGMATRKPSSTWVKRSSTPPNRSLTSAMSFRRGTTTSRTVLNFDSKFSTNTATWRAVNSGVSISYSPFRFAREGRSLISNSQGFVNIKNDNNKVVEKAPMANHSRPDDAKSELRAKSNADFIPNFDNPKWKTYTVKLNNPYSPRDPVLLQIVRAGRQNYQILVGFDEGYGYESTGSVGFYLDSNKLITSQFKPFDNFSANYYHKWSKQKIAKVIMAWIAQAAYQTNRTIESGFTGNLRLVNLREKFFADEVWVKNNQPDEYGQWEPLKAIGYHHFNHQIFGRIEVYVQENSRHKWRLIELDGDGLPDRVYRVINGWDLRFVYIDGKGNIYKFVQGRRGSKVGVLDDWQNYGALSHRGKPRPDRKLSRTKEPPTYNKKVFPRGGHQRRLKTETGVSREKRRRSSRSELRFSDPKSAASAKPVIPPSSELRVINQENSISDVSFESLTWESVIAPEIKGRAANSANQFEEAYATLPHSSIQEAVSLTAGQSEAIETDDNQTIIVYGVAPGMLDNLPIAYAGATVMRKSGPVVIFGGTQTQASFLKNHFFRDDNVNHSVNIVTRTNATTVLNGITGNNIKFVLYGVEGKDEHFADQLRSELRNVQFESRLESPDQLTARFGVDQIAESLRSELRAAWAQLTAA